MLLGFARSGTTTFQRFLAHSINYNFTFEPIGFNHANYPPRKFQLINDLFRNAPDLADMERYFMDGGAIAALHKITTKSSREEYERLLSVYFQWLIAHYGRNVVIKEVRLLFNLPTLVDLFEKAGLPALFVLLRSDPLNTLYTFYRLGGLIKGRDDFDHRVDEFYSYHRAVAALDTDTAFPDYRCRNKWEKLLTAVVQHHKMMEYFSLRFPRSCILADFEKINEDVTSIAKRVKRLVEPPIDQLALKPPRYTKDTAFLQMATQHLSEEAQRVAGVSLPKYRKSSVSLQQRFQFTITKLQNRLLEI
ncbi:MAG: hypothetical protein QF375_04595 [Arenicellales bacterium]|jgi:hypothetical protein|nr:hypothetical protein [Arenicellales bacterium]|tara:strand:+ start:403 stop:1317 length:915 start_codon:yes stop_codon:yes gene_type:complete